MRIRAAFGGLRPVLRARQTDVGGYDVTISRDGKTVILKRLGPQGEASATLGEVSLSEPLWPEQVFELELRVVGKNLAVKMNGSVVATGMDGTTRACQF